MIAYIIVAISKKRKKRWRQKWKKCPACAEKIKAEAKICRFCGNSLSIGTRISYEKNGKAVEDFSTP